MEIIKEIGTSILYVSLTIYIYLLFIYYIYYILFMYLFIYDKLNFLAFSFEVIIIIIINLVLHNLLWSMLDICSSILCFYLHKYWHLTGDRLVGFVMMSVCILLQISKKKKWFYEIQIFSQLGIHHQISVRLDNNKKVRIYSLSN